MSDDDRLPNPDDLDGRAAEIERQRQELEAERQRLEQLQRQRDLDTQEQELQRRRDELDAQRAHLDQQAAPPPQPGYGAPTAQPQGYGQPGYGPGPAQPAGGGYGYPNQTPAGPPTQPTPQVPYAAPPAATPPPRRTGVIALVGLVALAIGGAAGWFGYDVLNDDTDSAQEVATDDAAEPTEDPADAEATDPESDPAAEAEATAEPTAAEEPTATPVPVEVTTWKSGDGDLQASFPADYTVAWDTQEFEGVSGVLLYGARDFPASVVDGFNRFTGETVNAGAYTRPGLTPEILLGEVFEPDAECTGEDPPETVEFGGRSGLLVRSTDCGGVGGERIRIGLQDATDVVTYVSVRSATAGGGSVIAEVMATSLSTQPATDTPVAAPYGCALVGPSPDAEFPIVTVVVNRTDDTIEFYELDPATGGPYSGAQRVEIEPGFSRYLTFKSPGGFVLRIDRPQGPLDYTMTDALAQCILVTDEGLLAG